MQVSIEESGVIERKLTISVPSEEIEQEVTKRLKELGRKARVPGFRPGKAPQRVITNRYAPQITNEVIGDTINSSYKDALGQEEIVPAGLVSIDPTPYEPGKDLQYVATVELFPQIPNPNLEGITIEKPVVAVTKEDVDLTLEDIRKRNTEFVSKKGKSAKGDQLTIDFEGTIDGNSFNGGSAQDFQFVLGEGQMLKEFDSGLGGVEAGETKTIEFRFDEDYGNAEIAGKDVEFSVTVKEVKKPKLPKRDDAFAESLGIKDGGIDKMKQEIKESLNRELNSRVRSVIRDRVMEALYVRNDIEPPKALVEEEIERSVAVVTKQLSDQGLPADKIDRDRFTDEAKKRVALGLIAREVIEKSEIKTDRDTVQEYVAEMAKEYDDSEAYVNWQMSDPERFRQMEAMVLEEKIVSCMLDTATVTEKKMSFKAFMNPEAKGDADHQHEYDHDHQD